MNTLDRLPENPILTPKPENDWEAAASFNPCVAFDGKTYHMVYRALSFPQPHRGTVMSVSSIGYATSKDGVHWGDRRRLIEPKYDWEAYGCEDPRITRIGKKYYIFYTALSRYPFSAEGIRVAVAVTENFRDVEKHPVTTFNAKAMALFPQKIGGKLAAILTANTDRPPAKIAIARFDKESDIWSPEYWQKWYASLDDHLVPLLRNSADQLEVGAPPIKTKKGWLFVYAYIKNYRGGWGTVFGTEAALLDAKSPQKVIGRTSGPILVPDRDYERNGIVPNIAFPSGAILKGKKLVVYYGAADTTSAAATMNVSDILKDACAGNICDIKPDDDFAHGPHDKHRLVRFSGNPILSPVLELSWENKAVFNPAAIYEDKKVHIVYRAMGNDNTSVLGYASSRDGFRIDERLSAPIYAPRTPFEEKRVPGGNSGVEDPRITKIGDMLYMCYTAYNGAEPPRVALTAISLKDFLAHRWNWERPVVISPPNYDDKDACLLPRRIEGKYLVFHRLGVSICVDFADDLRQFNEKRWLEGITLLGPRENYWDNAKIGIAAPPIETKKGWLLLYHGVSVPGNIYRVGAALLDLKNPTEVIARTDYPVLGPEAKYEREGQVSNVVFPCGAVTIKGRLFVYYGGADSVIGVATINLNEFMKTLT